jgi:hypothetical protein
VWPWRAGAEHDLLTHAGGPHAFDQSMEDPVVAALFVRVLALLGRHLKGRLARRV